MTSTTHNVVQIRPGTTAEDALGHAACLLRGLRAITSQGVSSNGLDADSCYLVGASIDTLIALVGSVDARIQRAA